MREETLPVPKGVAIRKRIRTVALKGYVVAREWENGQFSERS